MAGQPSDGTTSKPPGLFWIVSASQEEATGPLRRPRGPFTSRAQAPRAERTPRQVGCRRSEDETLSPAGLCTHTAPRSPAQRPLGEVVRPHARGARCGPGELQRQHAPRGRRGRGRGGGSAVRGHPLPRGPRAPSLAPRGSGGLRGKPSRMAEATHRPRGTHGGRGSRNGRLRRSPSRVCQKEAGRLWSGAEACGVTARGGAVRSAPGRASQRPRRSPGDVRGSGDASAQRGTWKGPGPVLSREEVTGRRGRPP